RLTSVRGRTRRRLDGLSRGRGGGAAAAVGDGGASTVPAGAAGVVAPVAVPPAARPRVHSVPARDAIRRSQTPGRAGRRRHLSAVVPARTWRRRFSVNR